MTFDEIVAMVANDLNLTQETALTRIGTHVNRRYRRVLAALGMNDFSRVSFPLDLEPNSSEQVIPDDNDPVIERIVALYRPCNPDNVTEEDGWYPMTQLSYEQMREEVPGTGLPTKWAKKRVGAFSTVFIINSTIENGATVLVEGEEHASELADDDVPQFNEAFHEILVFGAKAEEYRKQKDASSLSLANSFEGSATNPETTPNSYNGMLAQLRLKSVLASYGDFVPGKDAARGRRPWQRC